MARSKNRASNEINSGSMADIAFLLLIFFLVTTTIANDKGIAMLLPPKPKDNEVVPQINKNDRNIFKILANSQDRLLVEDEPLENVKLIKSQIKEFVLNFHNPNPEAVQTYNSLPPSLKSFVNSKGRRADYSDDPEQAVVSFKAARGTSYDVYVRVLDQINAAYNEIYAERVGLTVDEYLALDKSDPVENEIYERSRKGIPRAISIAEPDKIGGK